MECFIIIIIRYQLGLDRPVSTLSNSLFTCLPIRLRPFGLKFNVIFGHPLAVSLHVVANLICIFFVSRQLVLLSTLQKNFLIPFVVPQGAPSCFSEKKIDLDLYQYFSIPCS
jgi:hypothetical protein